MTQSLATGADAGLAFDQGLLADAINSIWRAEASSSLTDSEMNDVLDTVFSSVARAVDRSDRGLLGWLADRLTTTSAHLLRSRQVDPSLYFAVYARALGDLSHALSADNGALQAAYAKVGRRKAVLPLISALNNSPNALTASELAARLSMTANNLSPVLRDAEAAGLVSCMQAGRVKYCSVTRLGQSYLDAVIRPRRHRVSAQLIDQYWTLAMQATDSEEAEDLGVQANPSLTTETLKGLYQYATRADGERLAVLELRERLAEHGSWVLVFKKRTAMMETLGRITSPPGLHCEVVRIGAEHVEFRPTESKRGSSSFRVAYRYLLEKTILLKEPSDSDVLAIEEPDFYVLRSIPANEPISLIA